MKLLPFFILPVAWQVSPGNGEWTTVTDLTTLCPSSSTNKNNNANTNTELLLHVWHKDKYVKRYYFDMKEMSPPMLSNFAKLRTNGKRQCKDVQTDVIQFREDCDTGIYQGCCAVEGDVCHGGGCLSNVYTDCNVGIQGEPTWDSNVQYVEHDLQLSSGVLGITFQLWGPQSLYFEDVSESGVDDQDQIVAFPLSSNAMILRDGTAFRVRPQTGTVAYAVLIATHDGLIEYIESQPEMPEGVDETMWMQLMNCAPTATNAAPVPPESTTAGHGVEDGSLWSPELLKCRRTSSGALYCMEKEAPAPIPGVTTVPATCKCTCTNSASESENLNETATATQDATPVVKTASGDKHCDYWNG